ncbi:helix-turn-helix transcriptional regulator [Mycobacterium nebraskense]|uniref:Transcriptional regulator n=1 Tax=Mycobacterium nebraskense TaxID=244292 RepID=A0A0F5NBS0_9MYCO|nr:helix-turn-helix domain-containing protein [Mycobacterium nebraskense]KKC04509.1 transcriptional regulator [Mycobacterium nebraskense]KLO44584.1 transcriptional regulator [Mycobacterium nebraskense]MBI2692745.1 MarR family transcriptional regulator [Mycobacterium nebraskense]MCV7115777.1 MarR family transcriptional regulator [Mycobacterium nebraskense]ORW14501.1 transcriptional regulator [Mycobacterium nebraskense]
MKKDLAVLGPEPTPVPRSPVALSGQRLRVLEYVRAHSPVRVADAANALDLHPNTVREHLDAVVGLGLVERSTATALGRGRPATLYRVSAADPAVAVRDYAGLATALAGQLARTSAHPERDARAAGIEWGRELIDEGNQAGSDPRQSVLEALTRLGFAPDDEKGIPGAHEGIGGIALRRCPLLDAARRYPTVVCQVHLGIVEGMLERLGAPSGRGLDLIPFAEPGACRLFLPDPGVRHGD